MKQKIESWKIFDQISPSYDRINQILSFGQDRFWRRFAAKHLPLGSPLTLLDLAAGTLDQLIACMESKASIPSAVAVDLSQSMLEIGKAKIQNKSYATRVQCQVADALALPFSNDSFDAITFSFGIRNVNDPLQSLREMKRLLRKGGRALILEFSLSKQPFRPFHLFYLRTLLPKIGGWLSKNQEAYSYLHETIVAFPYGPAFCALMEEAGLSSVRALPLALGAVTLYIGEKEEV